ncbi:hypothetical protein ACWIGI_31690 [Nocardia sp. NPDC055321]
MPSNTSPEPVEDPRAHWRHLPPEPTPFVEETQVAGTSSSFTVPSIDPAQDFIRLYGG